MTHGQADWEAAAAAVLRKSRKLDEDAPDRDVWTKLTRTTLDGIAVTPLGIPSDLEGLETTGRPERSEPWDVRSWTAPGPTANAEILADLAAGVTSIWYGGEDVEAALAGVMLDVAPVILSGTATDAFLAMADEFHPHTNLGFDALTATKAQAERAWDAGVLGFVVDATKVADRGATDVQELGYAIAVAAQCVSETGAAALIEFRISASDQQFPTIAKFRAARRLWERIAPGIPMRIHAVTSRAMMTKYDPWVNMLRTTVAAFAAGVGGADSVTVLPFDSVVGRPDALGRRIARNTSALLIAESHVAKVADPAGGSYAVEKLTDDVAKAAWDEFGRVVSDGFEAQHDRIAEAVALRNEQVALRKMPITGISEFPNLGEDLPQRAPSDDFAGVARYAAPYEALRDEPAAAPVFLATMGTVAAHTARATFATNAFAAGGVRVNNPGATTDVDSVLSHYNGEQVACLAGTDAAYAEWGEPLAKALREAGAKYIVIAGKQTDWVDDACGMGMNALEFLARVREALA